MCPITFFRFAQFLWKKKKHSRGSFLSSKHFLVLEIGVKSIDLDDAESDEKTSRNRAQPDDSRVGGFAGVAGLKVAVPQVLELLVQLIHEVLHLPELQLERLQVLLLGDVSIVLGVEASPEIKGHPPLGLGVVLGRS